MLRQINEALEDARLWELAATHLTIMGEHDAADQAQGEAAGQRGVAQGLALMVSEGERLD